MERLYKAAVAGSVPSLLQLLREDELLLERHLVGPHSETPLHIAAMLGHAEFVDRILSLKPELASELDSQRSTPLHLAAAKGYVDIVKVLLRACPEACFMADNYGRNPLQVAAVKGKVEVLKVLVQAAGGAARSVSRNGDTVLHMCVKYNKLESLKALVGMFGGDDEFIDLRDKDGNSALHLAAADAQFETVDFLTTQTRADINSPNLKGFTSLDLLAQTKTGAREKAVTDSVHVVALDNPTMSRRSRGRSSSHHGNNTTSGEFNWKKHFKRQNSWLVRMQNSLLVVATLTAAMTFQAGMNPPAGVWQENLGDNSTSVPANNSTPPGLYSNKNASHFAGESIMADTSHRLYLIFLVSNTVAFIASLSIIILLISGLPIRRRLFVWVLMVIMWIVISSIALSYTVTVAFLTPRGQNLSFGVIGIAILSWILFITLLLFLHTIRLIVKFLRTCWRAVTTRKQSVTV